MHADLFGDTNGWHIIGINEGDQSLDVQGMKSIVAHETRSFGGISLSPGCTPQSVAELDLWLSMYIQEIKQAAVPNHIARALLDDRIRTKSAPLVIFQAGPQPGFHPLAGLDTVTEAHHLSIPKYIHHRRPINR